MLWRRTLLLIVFVFSSLCTGLTGASAASYPTVSWPTVWGNPVGSGSSFVMTTKYGALSKDCPNHDRSNDAGWYVGSRKAHLGIDMARGDGEDVFSIGSGSIKYAGTAWGPEWGFVVVVQHSTVTRESFLAVYAHLHSDTVVPGDRVRKNDRIGRVMDTGSGPHLHFGLAPGVWTGTVPRGSIGATIDANGNCVFNRSGTTDGLAWLKSRTPAGVISTSKWYGIQNLNSRLCVDAAGGGIANGTAIQQYTCNSTSAQQYRFLSVGSGYYKILKRGSSNQVVDVRDRSTTDGAKIHLWTYVGGSNQQWRISYAGSHRFRFVARHSGRCLDVPGASRSSGVQLQQYACNGTNAQYFYLTNG